MTFSRFLLWILAVTVLSGCAHFWPEPYDPAEFDSRAYYDLDTGETGDSVLALLGGSFGYGSAWPAFGSASAYSSSGYSGYSGYLGGYTARVPFHHGYTHYPIRPVMAGRYEPGGVWPSAGIAPGSRPHRYSKYGRIGRGAREGYRAPAASRPYTSLSRRYARPGRSGVSQRARMPHSSTRGRAHR